MLREALTTSTNLELTHSNFFVLRTPLLPAEELTGWSDGLIAARTWEETRDATAVESAWIQDVGKLRTRLLSAVSRMEIMHALYVASPSLQTGIEHWKKDPDSKKGLQAERALVRYFERMVARSTPFGLFSGCSVGRVDDEGDGTTLRLTDRSKYRNCCRLDFDYLFALTTALRQDPALEAELRYYPNSSLHKVADAWHYVESRMSGSERSHHLVRIESDSYLDSVIATAEGGATLSELSDAVLRTSGDANPSNEEANEYVLGLVRDNEILVSDLVPLLTGKPPLDDIIDRLETLPSGYGIAESLRDIRGRILALEKKGLQCPPDDYRAIAAAIKNLPGKSDLGKLFQVDMIKPVDEAVLSKPVISELVNAVEALCLVGETNEPEELKSFREAFSARYESAMVPLLDALDDESGIGFGLTADRSDASPLVRGLPLNKARAGGPKGKMLGVDPVLFRQLIECLRKGETELNLDLSEFEKRKGEKIPPNLADALCLTGALAGNSPDAVRRGEFELYLHLGFGPSGAQMLGRFSYADPQIEQGVRRHLQQEEAHNVEASYAEVVYLPEGRVGNVLCRPVLRAFEIPYLGRSGATAERQLPVNDLLVGMEDDKIVLYSRRLNRQVVPRLSNAHSFMNPRLSSLYRFLCCLQHQQAASVPRFSWGGLETLDHLPRVRVGRILLSLAQWRLSAMEVDAIAKEEGSLRFIAMQELRAKRGLPRWVAFQEGDNNLPVDLDNALSVDAFIHVLQRGSVAKLTELYPSPERLCVTGPEGSFFHELNVPLVQKLKPPKPSAASISLRAAFETSRLTSDVRVFSLGSEWLYVKLYGGTGVLDDILTTTLDPLVRELTTSGRISRWFFIRYSDPHDHLRVRINGDPERLIQEVLPLAAKTLNRLLLYGKLYRVEFDVYRREIERYGGIDGTLAAEDLFYADSEAVLDILRELTGDEGLDVRWRIGLAGIDQMLTDFGLDQIAKRAIIRQWRDSSQSQFKINIACKRQLSDRFRAERSKLESLLDDSRNELADQALARTVFRRRSVRNVEISQRLHRLAREGRLTIPIPNLLSSYVHMHINRLIRASQRAHEIVLYDFLFQLYNSKVARKGN